jgi:LmbE family N-acetylglucosaminyl deacetylase
MRRIQLGEDAAPLRVLCLGAHADDIEIGCGGTIRRWAREGRLADVRWVVLSAEGPRQDEAQAGAAVFLEGASSPTVQVESFRDGFFPSNLAEIKERFESLKSEVVADVILTHRRDDAHQDHRAVNELAWNTFRDHVILEFEIPKYDGDLVTPNVYVELDEALIEEKARLLDQVFGSQRDRHWFSRETFLGLARVRGVECRSAGGYAEGFVGRKLVL